MVSNASETRPAAATAPSETPSGRRCRSAGPSLLIPALYHRPPPPNGGHLNEAWPSRVWCAGTRTRGRLVQAHQEKAVSGDDARRGRRREVLEAAWIARDSPFPQRLE
ncbi:hypothetical protein GCM10009546_24750 [Actinomadura livida]|uniref:Uncharacterized protein n=1 Tax=Actinomadura livida TaxID=79909 RepID=A0ABN1E914_9ACTN|nr:hypothetical protein GCM10010208_39110 [Actinomadura livida]